MKLTINEKKIIIAILEEPDVSNKILAQKLGISTQAVGKIKTNLKNKKLIDRHEIILDYNTTGINCFVLTLVKIMPIAFKKYKKEIKEIFSNPNIVTLINIPQTRITNIILFGFRNVNEYSDYFRLVQSKLPGFIEIKESYVFSNDSILKNSSTDLFRK
jgi:DNA-binding Lrp family transcriptional regulator